MEESDEVGENPEGDDAAGAGEEGDEIMEDESYDNVPDNDSDYYTYLEEEVEGKIREFSRNSE